MSTKTRIRKKVLDFTSGRIGIRKFREWFLPVLWAIEDCGDQDTIDLAYGIELAFSEYKHRHRTNRELIAKLTELIVIPPVQTTATPR